MFKRCKTQKTLDNPVNCCCDIDYKKTEGWKMYLWECSICKTQYVAQGFIGRHIITENSRMNDMDWIIRILYKFGIIPKIYRHIIFK